MKAAIVAIVLAGSLGACLPTLNGQSVAPPGREAHFDAVEGWWSNVKWYRLELSEGVAYAVTCTKDGPCEKLVATSDDPAIAEVRRAALQRLEPSDYGAGATMQAASSAVVIVGKRAGTTTVRLRSKDGDRDIKVTIVTPPPIGTPATAAR